MKVNVQGIRNVNFQNNEGQTIAGTSVWLSFPLTGEGASGNETQKYFIADGGEIQASILKVGQDYTAGFNNRGKLVSLIPTATSSIPTTKTGV